MSWLETSGGQFPAAGPGHSLPSVHGVSANRAPLDSLPGWPYAILLVGYAMRLLARLPIPGAPLWHLLRTDFDSLTKIEHPTVLLLSDGPAIACGHNGFGHRLTRQRLPRR